MYPCAKSEGILDAVNRLPVPQGHGLREECEGCIDQKSGLYCIIPRIPYVARASSEVEVIY